MLGKSPDQNQLNLFLPILKQIINPAHELVTLADKFPWGEMEEEFAPLYADKGARAKPVRLMTGLLVLKNFFNHSDEKLIIEWVQNPYYQYFCGEVEFQWYQPCDPSDITHFRKRIGEKGLEKINRLSSSLQEKRSFVKQIYYWLKPKKKKYSLR